MKLPDQGTSTEPSRWKPWLPHIALLALAFVMCVVAWSKHIGDGEALATALNEEASTEDRIWAMHVAANRATQVDPRIGYDVAKSFLASDDELLREAGLLVDLCRHAIRPTEPTDSPGPPLQEAYAYGPLPSTGWTPHRIRSLILHRRKVGGAALGGVRRMALEEAQWFLDSLAGVDPPTAEDVRAYFKERVQSSPLAYPRSYPTE